MSKSSHFTLSISSGCRVKWFSSLSHDWYNYLYDEEKKAAFEQDRIKVAEQNYEDHYLTTDMETMERLL